MSVMQIKLDRSLFMGMILIDSFSMGTIRI